jgi:hypothetical protein
VHAVLPVYQNLTDACKIFMEWYIILLLISLLFCLSGCIFHLYKIIHYGKPVDYSEPIGKTGLGIFYSFTGGMNPVKKESAFLHLPTYSAGIIYHFGTFLAISLLAVFLFEANLNSLLKLVFSLFLGISGICGIAIFFKRIIKKDLSLISNPDDYISNLLVTGFQVLTIVQLNFYTPVYFILTSILLLYLPLGKLRHTIYFFSARYHLGFFYGRRGVWPPKN